MTTKFFFAAVMCCMGLGLATEASANSWRVNYDKRANADFQDLNAAMADDRVANGDTLYMDKGCTISTEQTISKAVTVIGPGYFIGENDADEAYFSNDINLEADGIKLTGLHISNVNIRENNAVIERCRVTGDITATEKYENDNACIRSCFVTGAIKGQGTNGSDEWNVLNNIFYLAELKTCIDQFENILVDHNTFNLQYHNWTPQAIGANVSQSRITNNIIFQDYTKSNPVRCTNSELQNTISNNVSNYNFDSDNVYPKNLIITGLKETDIFKAQGKASIDSYYGRINYSDIDAFGSDGASCGVTAGGYPYVDYGYPLFVPRIESITIPSQPDANGNLPVRIVVKNQNQ